MPTPFLFEDQIQVLPIHGHERSFESKYGAWGYPGLTRIAGSIPLGEGAVAAQRTVPKGFRIHNCQTQFAKAGVHGQKLQYEVEDINTGSKYAVRAVRAKQQGVVRALMIFSFFNAKLDDGHPPTPFDYEEKVSQWSKEVAKWTFDDTMDDFRNPEIMNVPKGTPYPAFSSNRIKVTDAGDPSKAVFRIKMRIRSPLSSPEAQVQAVIWMSDMYAVDGPLWNQGLTFGIPAIGDREKKPTEPLMEQFASINHSVHFYRLSGWDCEKGVLFEVMTWWARARRAVATITVRDHEGGLIATVAQEGYYAFLSPEAANRARGPGSRAVVGQSMYPKLGKDLRGSKI